MSKCPHCGSTDYDTTFVFLPKYADCGVKCNGCDFKLKVRIPTDAIFGLEEFCAFAEEVLLDTEPDDSLVGYGSIHEDNYEIVTPERLYHHK